MVAVIEDLAADGRGFLAIRPLFEGVLTDRFTSHSEVPPEHRLAKAKYADAFLARERLAKMIPEAGAGMTRFATRFPLLSDNCASVIVGLNSEAQVDQICSYVTGVEPDASIVARVHNTLND